MFNRGTTFRKPARQNFGRGNRFSRQNGKKNTGMSPFELEKAVIDSKRFAPKVDEVEEIVIDGSFLDFGLEPTIVNNIKEKGYLTPTPIQEKTIPTIMEGKDLIGIANTGTGKTAAFLIPLINKVIKDRTQKVLIITPTRELALQIEDELKTFAKGLRINSALCIGGASMFYQKRQLYQNPAFVIGTPGRIKDLSNQRALNLKQFNNVVLDETDRMVDIGFINEIKFFISLLPALRQSLFFSATVSLKVKEIIQSFVQNPVTVSVKQKETSSNVNQELIKVKKQQKISALHDVLISENVKKTLIFGRTKHGVEKLSKELIERGFKAAAIHGDKRQNQRQSILFKFKKDEINILLATDVASRGLDINDVTHVINYDLPESYEDYVHRIGRTGRGSKTGTALTFIEIE